MRNLRRALVVSGLALIAAVLAMPAAAQAAIVDGGYDVSYPQCPAQNLPTGQAFGVVGVNGGIATTPNNCLSTELSWAWKSSGALSSQPKAQVYLNTANPGQSPGATWPHSGSTPYGDCKPTSTGTGANSNACSWQYGWERAQNDVTTILTPAASSAGVDTNPASYTWWLDVETTNTWQTGSSQALARNRATLEGMNAYLTLQGGATVGVYSTSTQWHQIAGYPGSGSTLYHLDSWLAGATTFSGARANCAKKPLLAGGQVLLAQYVVNNLDHDVSCR